MPKFKLYIEQKHLKEGLIKGFYDQEGSELVDTARPESIGWFTLDEVGELIKHSSYDGCVLMKAEIWKVELDEEDIFLEAGAMVIGDEERKNSASLSLAVLLRLGRNDAREVFDQAGLEPFIAWIRAKVEDFR